MNTRLGRWPGRTGTPGGVPGGLGVGAPPTREGGKLPTRFCVRSSQVRALCVDTRRRFSPWAVCAVVALVFG